MKSLSTRRCVGTLWALFSLLGVIACGGGKGNKAGRDGGETSAEVGGTPSADAGEAADVGELAGGDGTDWQQLPVVAPASFTRGSTDIMGPGVVIDGLGGTIQGAPGSPLEGVVVTVPAGAVSAASTFSLGYNVGGSFQNLKGSVPGPIVLVINVDGQHQFAKPLSVVFPYPDPEKIAVPFYLSPEGTFTLLSALPIDRVNGLAGFLTWHASQFMWVDAPAMSSPGRKPDEDRDHLAPQWRHGNGGHRHHRRQGPQWPGADR